MRTSKKAKTPEVAATEVNINVTTQKETSMNNSISIIEKSQLTMSSREIAKLTDKLHKNVLADIKNMFDVLEIQSADFSADYKDSRGRTYQEYLLPKKYIECLLTGYSIPLRMKVIDRMHQLEEKAIQSLVPQTYPEALRLAAELAEEKLQLESKVEEMRDDVEAFERIAKADGSVNLTSAAKHLQYPPHKFNQLLNSEGWIYKRRGQKNWLGYQDKVKQGLLTHKVNMYQLQDGTEMINEQVLVTPKGLTKLSQILSIH